MIQIDSKSRQWFGATVRSSGDDGVVMVSNIHDFLIFLLIVILKHR